MLVLVVTSLAALLLWLLYRSYKATYKMWEVRGFPHVPASIPFGSDYRLALLTEFQGEALNELYTKTNPSPYFGIHILKVPYLVLRDPEIVRLVLAKEFSHFRDRQGFDLDKNDFLSHHLFNLEGERWRALRTKLSPTFTSGKLKAMFPIFTKCSQDLQNLLLNKSGSSIDIKDVLARFTMDTICSCAFGVEGGNTNSETDTALRRIGKDILRFNLRLRFQMIFFRTFPSLMGLLPFRLTDKHIEDFIIGLIKNGVDIRRSRGVKRNDFLDLLIELQDKGSLGTEAADHHSGGEGVEVEGAAPGHPSQNIEMTTELMAAQCFVFFAAGFETSSSVQSFCLYELALHPEIQERLYGEIRGKLEEHGGELTYQAVQEMEYLDMVIHETMRKYPTLPWLTRRCTSPMSMPAGNRLEAGDRVLIPVWSLHHNPDYFPEPQRFDPERFSQERKASILPYSYLPFGEGPRICIGMRFGLLQTKVGLATVLSKFRVSPSKETEVPLKFRGSFLVTNTRGPISLQVTPRSE